jgi:hypothetical protein
MSSMTTGWKETISQVIFGDNMNTILASTGFNMMKMLKRLKTCGLENYFHFLKSILFPKTQFCLILN